MCVCLCAAGEFLPLNHRRKKILCLFVCATNAYAAATNDQQRELCFRAVTNNNDQPDGQPGPADGRRAAAAADAVRLPESAHHQQHPQAVDQEAAQSHGVGKGQAAAGNELRDTVGIKEERGP